MDSLLYKFHLLLLTPYIGIFILMIIFRVAHLNSDATCIISLKRPASIPLMVYDFVFNSYLTLLFIRPLIAVRNVSREWSNSDSLLTRVTRRTLVSCAICLIASTVNIFMVALLHGEESDFICLTMCSFDVILNVITVHWVTTGTSSSGQSNELLFPELDLQKNQDGPKKSDMNSDGSEYN
ncbi:hypothetical protein BC938DRAFT_478509 [Jimgerdemannia flammicorona]|uniref:G-protein coupled receptors family 1 profile domain-containing protein n=1 Tax=Jimgerdemannia flammicorona TaxID=994334 RepID=A0A433QMT2_9FUNG|nr:hypothetical protein BC938DRAFT_478509 [Jimgerdemannia flammicorona]